MAADPTPTTVGIIQGDVRLDADAFHEEIARVRAAVATLREDDPRIRVEAETGDALARLAEVEAASEAASGGRSIQVDATGTRVSTANVDRAEAQASMDLARARVLAAQATEALNASEAEHAATGFEGDTLRPAGMGAGPETSMMSEGMQELSTASEDAAKATDDAAAAAKREKIILDGLDAAAAHTAGSLGGFEEAQRKAADASKGSGNGGGMGQFAIVATVIAALLPLVAPLGGYLVGVAGGFTAMGGAGVLAVLGVMKAMQDGTAVGNEYRAGLSTLGDGLDQLEATAAKATLPGFTQTVAVLQTALPGLNTMTGEFGSMLGATVAPAAKAVLDVMTALAPAFEAGAAQVQDFVAGLDGWATGTNGAKAFGSYMVGVMPQVGEVLNHVVTTVGLLVTELAPLGSVMLGIVNVALGLVNVAEGLGPAFAPVVAAALALWGAMKGWGMLAPLLTSISAALGPVAGETAIWVEALATSPGILDAMSTGEAEATAGAMGLGEAIDFATGPVGWIVGLIGALAAGLLVAANSTNAAATATEDYTAAVQQDNGVVAENTRQHAANALAKDGAEAAGAKLGLSLKTLTDAATGNAAATKQVNAAIAAQDLPVNNATASHSRFHRALTDTQVAAQQVRTAMSSQSSAIKDAIKQYNDLEGALGGAKISTAAQLHATQDLAHEYGTDVPTYLAAVEAQKKQKAQTDLTTVSLQRENDAASLLKNALDILNGKTLGVAQAQTGAAAATNSLMDSLKQNGTAIDGNSKKAVANQQAIQSVIQANQQVAEAIGKATGRSKDAVKSYEDSKTAMEHNLSAAGLLTAGMKRYIDKLYDLKNLHVPPTKLDVETAAAQTKMRIFQNTVNALHGTTVTVTAASDPNAPLLANGAKAYGGTIGAAYGITAGTVRGPGSALSDTAGLYRLANGEEVISNRNGQADAWRPLLKAINSGDFRGVRLGGGGDRAGSQTIKTVNMGGIHLHSPVAQDPVAAAEDASQMIAAYAGFPL